MRTTMMALAAVILLAAACGGQEGGINADAIIARACGEMPCPGATSYVLTAGAIDSLSCRCGSASVSGDLTAAGCSQIRQAWATGACH